MNQPVEVTEYTDPECSWAWGTEPKLRLLKWRFGERFAWRTVLGCLIPDGPDDGDFPYSTAREASSYWATVSAVTGMPYPPRLRYLARSTVAASRAAKAAGLQGPKAEAHVLRRMREATFLFGRPADNAARVIAALDGIRCVNVQRLRADMGSPAVESALRTDWLQTRQPNQDARSAGVNAHGQPATRQDGEHVRYVFPTLVFRGDDREATVFGWQSYGAYEAAMEAVAPGSTARPRPRPTVEQAFRRWPLLTECELRSLCSGAAAPPRRAIRYGGSSWFLPADDMQSLPFAD